MLLFPHIMTTVLQSRGGTAGIFPGGTKTLQMEGGKFAHYSTLRRSQGIGLATKDLELNITRHSYRPRESPRRDTVRRLKRLLNVADSRKSSR
jgi:hypothetical protein